MKYDPLKSPYQIEKTGDGFGTPRVAMFMTGNAGSSVSGPWPSSWGFWLPDDRADGDSVGQPPHP